MDSHDTADYLAIQILSDEELYKYNKMKIDYSAKKTYHMINFRDSMRGKNVLMSNLGFESFCIDVICANRFELDKFR